jgi:hypothetical protein
MAAAFYLPLTELRISGSALPRIASDCKPLPSAGPGNSASRWTLLIDFQYGALPLRSEKFQITSTFIFSAGLLFFLAAI